MYPFSQIISLVCFADDFSEDGTWEYLQEIKSKDIRPTQAKVKKSMFLKNQQLQPIFLIFGAFKRKAQ